MQKFHAKDPEQSKLGTRRAILQGLDSEYNMYSEYNKYNKTYNKVAMADYQAPNPKGGSKGGTERCRKDTVSWFSPQGFFTGFIKAL